MANFQLGFNQQVRYTLMELDVDGNRAAAEVGDVVSVISSNTGALTVIADATPVAGSIASGWLVGGPATQVGVGVTATLTHADGSSITTTVLVDVFSGQATTLSLSLGTPISQ